MLTAKDIEFLARKTKLNAEKTQSLFEEKEDGDLGSSAVESKKNHKKGSIGVILSPLYQTVDKSGDEECRSKI